MQLLQPQINAIKEQKQLFLSNQIKGKKKLDKTEYFMLRLFDRMLKTVKVNAAARLGLPGPFFVQKFGKTFEVVVHHPRVLNLPLVDAQYRYQVFMSAKDTATNKLHYLKQNGITHQRFRFDSINYLVELPEIAFVLDEVLEIKQTKEDQQQALVYQLKTAAFSALTDEAAPLGTIRYGQTVDNIFPVNDGWCRYQDSNSQKTWAITRDTTPGDVAQETQGGAWLWSNTTSNRWKFIDRAPMYFDLALYPSGISANLMLYIYSTWAGMQPPVTHVVPSTAPVSDPIALSDYDTAKYTMTSKGSIAYLDVVLNNYHAIALTMDVLNLGGDTRIACVTEPDLNNTPPPWGNNQIHGMAWHMLSGANPPYVELTSASAGGAGGSKSARQMLLLT